MRKIRSKKSLLVPLIAVLVVVFVIIRLNASKRNSNSTDTNSGQQQNAQTAAINGVMVAPANAQRPFAVIIENFPDARPQSGLSQADIVYEALAEGGITRYMAVFQTEAPKSIGPVRSARTYFVDWAQELQAIFVHVGGNSDALQQLQQGVAGLSDADQFYNGDYISRIDGRVPPHNTYTSFSRLQALAAHRDFSLQPSYSPYLFKDDAPAATPAVSRIDIQFSTSEYWVKWLYDKTSNSYKRYLAGSAVVDAGNNKNTFAKNVIVQRVRNWPVKSDTPLAISMGTKEGGSADVYMDGQKISGSWKIVDGRTKYFDQQGNEIKLNRGQTWIEIVPPDNSVTEQ